MTSTDDKATSSLPNHVAKALANHDIDSVEEAWMAHVESAPQDLEFFLEVAKTITKFDSEAAKTFLQILDEQLEQVELWPERLTLLQDSGRNMYPSEELHEAILVSLGKVHGEKSCYEAFVEKLGLYRAIEDIPKTWKKAERLESLLSFDIGTIVEMKGKGAARVTDINMALEKFKVHFDSGLELMVGFGGAAKLLQPLEKDHLLRRKMEDLPSLEKLRDEDPSELLRLALESAGNSLSGAEVKQMLAGLVTPKKWNSWWTRARKHPQVLVDPKNKRAYTWAASTEDAHGVLWRTFETAPPRDQIVMLRRDGERNDDLKNRMSEVLAAAARRSYMEEPGLAAEIFFNLERSGNLPDFDVPWRPQRLLRNSEDPADLVAGLHERIMREKAYVVAREERKDWPEVFAQSLWREREARSLDMLAEALEKTEPQRVFSFFDQLVSQPRKAPAAFTWLSERAGDRPKWMQRNPIRLLKQILFAFTHEDFSPFRAARLVPLAESGGTLPRILDHLSQDQAGSALEAVKTTPALEDYQRGPLINAIQLRFPNLHEKEAPFYATQAQIDAKEAELKKIAEQDIPRNREAIEEAREMGDLRENFEYHAARRRHELMSSRASTLDEALRRVRPIDASQVTGQEVVIGSKVTFSSADGERTITILGPWDSDPENGVLSNESEMAQKLMGSKLGEQAQLPEGEFEIVGIEPFE